jgi:DNA-directed RNA polymerase specialized sigma24 family protein
MPRTLDGSSHGRRGPDAFDSTHFLLYQLSDDHRSQLVNALFDQARFMIRSCVWPGGAPLAGEIVREAFANLLVKPERFRPRDPTSERAIRAGLQSYLRVIVVNLVRSELRRPIHARRDPLQAVDQEMYREGRRRASVWAYQPALRQEQAELAQRVRRFCQRRGYGRLFELYYDLDHAPREIAMILSISARTISHAIQSMKELIRRHFGAHAHELLAEW